METICVQGGYDPKNGEPRQIPIYQSTTFKYDTSEDMGKLFDLEASGYFYTRLQNPTNDCVAAKIASLEGGTAAMLTSSGQAANFFAVFNIATSGDHVVASSSIYGGTYNLFNVTMRKMGVDFTFLSPDASDKEIQAAFKPNTKAVFGETIANPALTVFDIERWANIAHKNGVPLIIDNTFPTPINCRPIEWGADIVVHSTTKYMDGHGAAVGGAIIDGGKFDWMAHADKFPGLCTPDDSYHGITYAEKFGNAGAFITKCTAQLMRDFGSIQSPQNAFYLNLGLESLHVRMPRHVANAQAVAEFLEKHPKIEKVIFPGLKSSPYHELYQKYLPNGGCGVVCFDIKGGRDAALKFMKSLKISAIETHVADARTCCLNPATTTHRQLTDRQLAEAGISPGLVRYSCGLENAQDLIDDLSQALDQI
ncbi:MAG: O-acetylhomoserine aminocarboxypropyltransferase/cysteine synthase [Clostridia bacterium]|nr:O-acetylhomoserine aminocarboxypropyltransferase/cysteine synthase [Clostridia bacterium]